jgi:heme/copper-type cytochrome/quinol oxidase subunit 1
MVLLTTTSYTLIATLYCSVGLVSLAIRVELNILGFYNMTTGSLDAYNRLISAHGLGMIFLFIMPILLSFAGNWQLPQSYHGADFVLPRVNLGSLYALVAASMLMVLALSREDGVSAGWTVYCPLSDSSYSSSSAVSVAILALHVLGLSSEGGSITFIASLLVARSTGIVSVLACLFSWTVLAASILLVLTLPVLGSGITILLLDRTANTVFLSPMLAGDPVLFQHLFWYFGHPEVYVIILPAFGIVSLTMAKWLKTAVAGHLGMVLAILSISVVGFFVWAHHMYVAGITEDSRLYFSSATMVIAVPTAVKIFTWLSSLLTNHVIGVEMVIVMSFLMCFTLGGFTGLVLSNASLDIVYHDTYYVVGHFHYVLSIAAAFTCLLILRMFATLSMYTYGSQILSRMAVLGLLAGINWLFGTQHVIGLDGHPRRIFHTAEAHHIITEVSNLSIPVLLMGPSLIIVACLQTSSNNEVVTSVGSTAIRGNLVSNSTRSQFMVRVTAIHEV